jgi:hypothetical protein
MPTGKPKDGRPETDTARDDDVPAWVTALPPEIRDAFSGGKAADIPAQYRKLLERYQLWMQKNQNRKSR